MRRGQRRADCFRRISISHGLQSYDGDPLSVGFSTCSTKEPSGVSTLQQCATRDCYPRGTPLTTAGFRCGTGTSKESLAPARVQIAPEPITTDRH